MSAQVAIHPEDIEGPNCLRSKFCAHGDVVLTCSKFKFILGKIYDTLPEIHIRSPQPITPYSGFAKWAFSYIPFVRAIYRFIIAATVRLVRWPWFGTN